MALQLWETFKEAITVYTGLSPAAFFTALALILALYYVVSGLFGSSDRVHYQRPRELDESMQPTPPPVQVGEITDEDLKQYDGSDPKKPLLMAIKGQIYDVTQSRMFYGPGGPYALFAGRDASRALAKMSFEEKDLTGDISGLGVFELEALQDWEYKFMSKYNKVGTVKKVVPVTNDEATATEGDSATASNVTAGMDGEPSEPSTQTEENGAPLEASREPVVSNEEPEEAGHRSYLSNGEPAEASHESRRSTVEPADASHEPKSSNGEATDAGEVEVRKPAQNGAPGSEHVKGKEDAVKKE